MGIFQKSVIDKYLREVDKDTLSNAYARFQKVFCDAESLKNIEEAKEEQFQEGFFRELFVNCLGYTINPTPNYNLTTEYKNISDSRKADGAIIRDEKPIGVIELKGTGTVDLKVVEKQAFEYRYAHPTCKYVITSNFRNLRFYIDTYEAFEEFNLFNMAFPEFQKLYVLLSKENIFLDKPLRMKSDSKLKEEDISDKLYKDYHRFKMNIFNSLVKNNPQADKVELLRKSQKLLDRILFIFFAEDRGLLPPNTISKIINENKEQAAIGREEPLYNTYKIYFQHIDRGNAKLEISEYNGGLFSRDELLDNLIIDDEVLKNDALKLSAYDFSTEIDVNILGHIFENSLNDIDELHAEVSGSEYKKSQTKRKKDGVFYTPNYITKFIVENTIGAICDAKKRELNLIDVALDTTKDYKRLSKKNQTLLDNLHLYREFLSSLKILDPACGSGAFLNQALEYLISEHRFIDLYRKPLQGDYLGFYDVRTSILENNLFGVDINEESIELARLSLWLRTAERGRKLNDLSAHIKCGNSIIDDKRLAGSLAFNWHDHFPEIMAKGGFDVVIGNPPYGMIHDKNTKDYFQKNYKSFQGNLENYCFFVEKSINLSIQRTGLIIPVTWLSIPQFQNLRELVLNRQLISFCPLPRKIFQDADLDTVIMILGNESATKKNKVDILQISIDQNKIESTGNSIAQKQWLEDDNFRIDLSYQASDKSIIEKIENQSERLESLFKVSQGIVPYAKEELRKRMSAAEADNIVDNRLWHSDSQKDDSFKRELKGEDVTRFLITWNGKQYVKYGDWLARPREKEFFTEPRVLIREITRGNKLHVAYTEEEYYNNPGIINIIQRNKAIHLKYLLCILNSKVMLYYHYLKSPKAKLVTSIPKILIQDVNNMPLKNISATEQAPFIKKSEEMIDLHRQFFNRHAEFKDWLANTFKVSEITGRLDNFQVLDFSEFQTEFKKKLTKGRILTPSELGMLKEHFIEYKAILEKFTISINRTDIEINEMVGALYGLTSTELKQIDETLS